MFSNSIKLENIGNFLNIRILKINSAILLQWASDHWSYSHKCWWILKINTFNIFSFEVLTFIKLYLTKLIHFCKPLSTSFLHYVPNSFMCPAFTNVILSHFYLHHYFCLANLFWSLSLSSSITSSWKTSWGFLIVSLTPQ